MSSSGQSARPGDARLSEGEAAQPEAGQPEQHEPPVQPEPEQTKDQPALPKVQVLDLPVPRVRRPLDLVHLGISLLATAVVVILSSYASSTTEGITQDVQSALAQFVRRVLLVPVTVIEGLLTLALPIVVIIAQVLRRNLRGAVEAIIASAVAFGIAALVGFLITKYALDASVDQSFIRWRDGAWASMIAPGVAALAGLLTAVGTRSRRRVVAISWNLLWVALGISVITGDATIVGALVAVLIGRVSGLGMRYAAGMRSERAVGQDLVRAIRQAGVEPLQVTRVGEALRDQSELPASSATVATQRSGANRVYAVVDSDGQRWDAVVLDGDRQVIGTLSSLWSVLRLRGLERRTAMSLRQAAERAALMYYASASAGINSPKLHGIAEVDDSVVLIGEHIAGAASLQDLPVQACTKDVMVHAWEQLGIAHEAGLAHRNLSAQTVLVGAQIDQGDQSDQGSEVWLNGWEQGEVAASQLAQRVDRSQLLAAFAMRTSTEHALDAASEVLTPKQLAEIAPLLQPVAFPTETRAEARSQKTTLAALRSALVEYIPGGSSDIEPTRLTRFSARTIMMLTIAVIGVWIVLTTLNFDQVRTVILQANPWWMAAAFGLGLTSYFGAALALKAFSPEHLGLWRTTLVQVAASVLNLVAPAGVAPAALSIRYMQRRGIRTSLALATAGLVQLAQFVTTVMLVVTLALFLGTAGPLRQLPALAVVVTLVVVAAIAGGVLLVPRIRAWVIRRVLPTWQQIWPRVVWVLGQPRRLIIGTLGALLVTFGFLASFAATLVALGISLPTTTLTIVFLTGNTVGSAVPTPGGIGAVELALSAALRTAGVTTAAAASAAVLFRVLTFWIRLPLGWLAWRYLQRHEQL